MTDLSLLTFDEALTHYGRPLESVAVDDLVLTVGSHINQSSAQAGKMKLREFVTVGRVAELLDDKAKVSQLHTYYADGGSARASGDEWMPWALFRKSAHEHLQEQREFFENLDS